MSDRLRSTGHSGRLATVVGVVAGLAWALGQDQGIGADLVEGVLGALLVRWAVLRLSGWSSVRRRGAASRAGRSTPPR